MQTTIFINNKEICELNIDSSSLQINDIIKFNFGYDARPNILNEYDNKSFIVEKKIYVLVRVYEEPSNQLQLKLYLNNISNESNKSI